MNINKQLRDLQAELKAPKGQRNNFGKYNYRSAEDILEALKPLAVKHGLTFTLSDDIVDVGDRVYVQVTASVVNDEGQLIESRAYAREEESKKGMDGSQVTGAASSYARKYALNGLLLIDDTKDSDATNTHGTPVTGGPTPVPVHTTPVTTTANATSVMDDAVAYIKGLSNKTDKERAYDQIIKKHGDKLTDAQKNGLKKFVR